MPIDFDGLSDVVLCLSVSSSLRELGLLVRRLISFINVVFSWISQIVMPVSSLVALTSSGLSRFLRCLADKFEIDFAVLIFPL